MAEDLVCPVCLSLFQEPHMLRCGHNFCLPCLESCVPEDNSTGDCPECWQPFSRQDFTCNRALANLAEKARRFRLDEEHLLTAAMVGLCEEHKEPLKLFCQQDLVRICVICRDLPQHQGHDCLPTKDAVKYTKEILKPYEVPLEISLFVTAIHQRKQRKQMEKLETCTEEILSHIYREFEVLHQILHEKEQDFKKTVGEMKAKNLQEMEEKLHSLKEKLSFHTEIHVALYTADHFAFLKDFKQLVDRVTNEFQPWEAEAEEEDVGDEEVPEEEKVYRDVLVADESDDEDVTRYGNSVVPLCSALNTFRDTLDFQAWKEMLERIQPRTFTKPLQ